MRRINHSRNQCLKNARKVFHYRLLHLSCIEAAQTLRRNGDDAGADYSEELQLRFLANYEEARTNFYAQHGTSIFCQILPAVENALQRRHSRVMVCKSKYILSNTSIMLYFLSSMQDES